MQEDFPFPVVHNRISGKNLVPNKKEVFRYLGYKKNSFVDENVQLSVEKAINEMQNYLKPQGLYEIFNLQLIKTKKGEKIKFCDLEFYSKDLSKNLSSCKKIALMAATIGSSVDFLIKKYTKLDVSKAAIFQACGAMFIEEYVEILQNQIKEDAKLLGFSNVKPRFSPGYGDVSLSLQKDFFRILPCNQYLGLTLMDSNIMAPEKSVTAFVGIF